MTGVVFIHEDDGRVTARHIESDVASFGDTEAEALRELADALEGHFDTAGSTDA
jgi:flagellar motor switch protein FliG